MFHTMESFKVLELNLDSSCHGNTNALIAICRTTLDSSHPILQAGSDRMEGVSCDFLVLLDWTRWQIAASLFRLGTACMLLYWGV